MSFEQELADAVSATLKTVSVRGKRVYKNSVAQPVVPDPYTFLDFVRNSATKFFDAFNTFSQTCPTLFNAPDYRMLKGLYSCSCLERQFGVGPDYIFKNVPAVGHDMLFHNGVRVSVKTTQKLFQRPWKFDSDKLTNAGNIMVRNKLGSVSVNSEQDYDFLLAAQTGFNQKTSTYDIGFAVATYETVCKNLITTNNDQVVANISNSAWDYFSGIETYEHTSDADKQNVVFKTRLNDLFTELGR